jgi:hypothetical protein
MRRFVIAVAIASLAGPAFSQGMSRGSKHRGAEQKTEQPKNKAHDKDYKSALDRIPAQKYDPWGTMRPDDSRH